MTTDPKTELEGLYRLIVTGMVEYPQDLVIHAEHVGPAVYITAKANVNDQGKLLGAERKTLDAVISIMSVAAKRLGVAARIILADPKPGKYKPFLPYKPKTNWDGADTMALRSLLTNISAHLFKYPPKVQWTNLSDTATAFVLCVRKEEPDCDNLELIHALQVVFVAVGKNKGRSVFLEVVPYGETQAA